TCAGAEHSWAQQAALRRGLAPRRSLGRVTVSRGMRGSFGVCTSSLASRVAASDEQDVTRRWAGAVIGRTRAKPNPTEVRHRRIHRAVFHCCTFTGCTFTGYTFTGCTFTGCTFTGCTFTGCTFTGCTFTG